MKDTYIKGVATGGGGSVGAKLMKTGQTVSYAANDDGALEAGRDTDFDTLASNNPFGNTNRWTDELGGSTYTNNIIIDWSTFDGAEVLGYKRSDGTLLSWTDALSTSVSLSVGTFTSGWRLANYKELFNLMRIGSRCFNWSPLNGGTGNDRIWSSTTPTGYTTSSKLWVGNAFQLSVSAVGNTQKWIPVRNFTVTGTTLT